MRIRIAAPVLAGALALGAAAAPTAAFAATAKPVITGISSPSATIGLGGKVSLGVTVTAKDAAGVRSIMAEPYPLALAKAEGLVPTAAEVRSSTDNLLTARSATATTLTASHLETDSYTRSELPPNALAGAWGVAVLVTAKDGSTTFSVQATTFYWRRADTLSSKVSATKVAKGAGLTVKGQLNRVNWDAEAYQGYGSQQVRLEFRRTGGTTWSTVELVRSGATGALSTTVKDTAGGSWRYVFDGNSTSSYAASTQTWVGLK